MSKIITPFRQKPDESKQNAEAAAKASMVMLNILLKIKQDEGTQTAVAALDMFFAKFRETLLRGEGEN